MKNVKNMAIASIGLSSLAVSNTYAAINPGDPNEVGQRQIWYNDPFDVVVTKWITNFMMFLILLAVVYGIWGGFNILTAAGDEEKVKKGKTIIINVLIGIVVIYVVGTLVTFLISQLSSGVQ